jgi:hypothetical protein
MGLHYSLYHFVDKLENCRNLGLQTINYLLLDVVWCNRRLFLIDIHRLVGTILMGKVFLFLEMTDNVICMILHFVSNIFHIIINDKLLKILNR